MNACHMNVYVYEPLLMNVYVYEPILMNVYVYEPILMNVYLTFKTYITYQAHTTVYGV